MSTDWFDRLKLKDKQYSDLLEQWKIAVSEVCKVRNEMRLVNYDVPEPAGGDELRFTAFGLRLFMRFRHSFEFGTIEYGVIAEARVEGQQLRIPVKRVQFDRRGNITTEPYSDCHVGEYATVHLEVLESCLDDLSDAASNPEAS